MSVRNSSLGLRVIAWYVSPMKRAAAVLLTLFATGCGETIVDAYPGPGGAGSGGGGGTESRFDPSGCDVHVRGRWQVDGQDPDAETCGNIALVELAIVNDSGDEFWVPAEFSLRCDAESDANAVIIDGGAYVDTRIAARNRCGGDGEILSKPATGEYKSQWRGLSDLRFIVDCSPIEVHQVTPIGAGTELLLDVGTVNLRTGPAGTTCPAP